MTLYFEEEGGIKLPLECENTCKESSRRSIGLCKLSVRSTGESATDRK